jgi:hypothetical protein
VGENLLILLLFLPSLTRKLANFTVEHLRQFALLWDCLQEVHLLMDVEDDITWNLTVNVHTRPSWSIMCNILVRRSRSYTRRCEKLGQLLRRSSLFGSS